jgi:CCR4-NOT transcription complex subunit 6
MIVRKYKNIKKSKNKMRVVTYNILAPSATKGNKHRLSCSEECLLWKNRFNLIKKEVLNEKPDIITFQEAQTNTVYKDIFPYFNSKGYWGYYIPQISPKYSFVSDEYNFGVVILFKISKFYSLKIGTIDFHKIAKRYLKKNKLKNLEDKIMKRFASLVMYLKDKSTGKKFYVITVHLEASPYFDDIKNLQGYIVMRYIDKISKGKVPIILLGDFNSQPTSSNYHGITTGKSLNKFDMENIDYSKPFINSPSIFSKFPLKSCYKEVFGKEPKHTNFTGKFKDTLDYIFVNSQINVLGAMEELEEKYIKNMKSIPDSNFPSDHFMQVADIELK